ncbi:hypothetical protein CHCC5027_3347 [Bacillus paralicheniformis]|nr:hypothetical protein CHCC5027_3347 [Bacillus paralicheniformis]
MVFINFLIDKYFSNFEVQNDDSRSDCCNMLYYFVLKVIS